jgi:signal transduction histidine kinase
MKPLRFKRLFGSVFTRLRVATLAAGLAITFTLIAGFVVIRNHSQSAFERNLMLYADYLLDDLGDPPDETRAREIARRSGMVIRFVHGGQTWQTGSLPRFLNLERAWVHHHPSGLTFGNSKGHHFIRLAHGGGELTFITPRDGHRGELALRFLVVMAAATITILGLSYLFLRKTLGPLRTLKAGVNEFDDGKLDHRIPEAGPSELRDLAQTFNGMAERLSRLLSSKEQLLLDVSHELRSPITRLKLQLEFIDDPDARETLRSDILEMERMVTNLLESARLRHASAALNLKAVNLGTLVRAMAADFQESPPGVSLGALVDEPVPADPEKIRIVMRNLVDNALKHTRDEGPAVTVAMARLVDCLQVIVEDKGEGIPESELPHLFEPFYRPDVSRSRKTGGYGLGLSLCKAIVDAHDGSIEIESIMAQGTRVTVSLPRSADAQKAKNHLDGEEDEPVQYIEVHQGQDDHEPIGFDAAVGHGLPGRQEADHHPAAVQRRDGDQVEDRQKDVELDGDDQKEQ